jgi:mannobiose 2-epimerase
MSILSEKAKSHLEKVILPFWENLKDDEFGGYYGYVDFDLKVDKKAVKGCILNSRILWFFSNAYLTLKDESILPYATHAYEFMKNYCFDKTNGGIYWSLNYDGTPSDTTKHTYNQAFAIYALSTYYAATGDKEALELANGLSDIIENKMTDDLGYLEAFTIDFKPESNEKLSENGVMAEKTMNTLLHVFEAYTECVRVSGNEAMKKRLYFMLDVIEKKIYNPELHRQEVFFDREYNTLIDLHSYGHDIETAWLVDRCLEVLGDEELTSRISPITKDLSAKIYDRAYVDHSLLNECEKGVDNTTRIWWVQAEAVVGFYNAYQKTGDEKYLKAACDIFDYIENKLTDKRPGSEWFWCLDENAEPSTRQPIVEPWKCPYHNGRMCMELIRRS